MELDDDDGNIFDFDENEELPELPEVNRGGKKTRRRERIKLKNVRIKEMENLKK